MDERLTDRELEILSGYVSGIVPRPSRATVGRLITELQAAREVVLNAQSWGMARGMMLGTRGADAADEFVSAVQALVAALARYEKAVKR